MDMAGKFTLSASMLLTGFSIVFGVLLLLIILISIYGKIVSGAQNKVAVRKTVKEKKSVKTETAKPAAEVLKPQQPEQHSFDGIPEEVVAVISAAVYSVYGSTQKVRIKSVKRSKPRSAWSSAGVTHNTRPF